MEAALPLLSSVCDSKIQGDHPAVLPRVTRVPAVCEIMLDGPKIFPALGGGESGWSWRENIPGFEIKTLELLLTASLRSSPGCWTSIHHASSCPIWPLTRMGIQAWPWDGPTGAVSTGRGLWVVGGLGFSQGREMQGDP